MHFEVLTLFPEIFKSFLSESLICKALEKQIFSIGFYNFREHGLGKHHKVDDLPYGGGPGMVLRPEPVIHAIESCQKRLETNYSPVGKVLLTPQGERFSQKTAGRLLDQYPAIMLICGRYEGFDERIRTQVDEEISGGDFITLGGEVIAMLMIEVISRLIPGVLGNQSSLEQESFAEGYLEYPQYTRPETFRGMTVPDVLLSGHHQNIHEWRQDQIRLRTLKRRPDLLH
ncbi:MAG: tRNA (guanosine(37)-N1)-methyltransferase TrmD [SAR324 cluster bacterium]|nr:tRNA (guanosine(37)-N1)-methyltransferase TrmD [SAR324 cluster bacterium]